MDKSLGRSRPAFLTALRCGARNRAGKPCRAPAMRGKKRCQMHGGKSTGPKTAEGRARSRQSTWVHGYYSAEAVRERREARFVAAAITELLTEVAGI
jgi:hypothetical protein